MADLIYDTANEGWVSRSVEWESAGKIRRGFFHKWVVLQDRVYAIVEKPDGKVLCVRMNDIKFGISDDDEFRKENEE